MVSYTVTDYRVGSSSIWLYTRETDRPKEYNGIKQESYDFGWNISPIACFTDEAVWYITGTGDVYKTFYDQYNLKLDYPEKWHREEESVPLANLCRYPD
jgi:hypothetical protein